MSAPRNRCAALEQESSGLRLLVRNSFREVRGDLGIFQLKPKKITKKKESRNSGT